MMVAVDICEDDVDGEHGLLDGLTLTCERCGHEVQVYGRSDSSARYAAKIFRDECPNDESNYYDTDWWNG